MASEQAATQRRNIANLIYQMVDYFMETVTVEQVQSFSSGVPDVMTKIWMTELTLDFISSLTKVYFTADVNECCDFSDLKDTLEQTFSKALKKDMTDNFSIALLSELIQEAVPENVKSIQMNGRNNNITPPGRLNVMFSCILEIFTILANKLMLDVSWQKRKQKQKSREYILSRTSLCSSKGKKDKRASKKSKKKASKMKSSGTDTKATEMICTLIAEVPGDEFKKVMAETFRQLLSSDEQVTGFLFNAQKDKESFEQVAGKFKEYLSMCFTKAWINNLLERLKWEEPDHSELHESLLDFVYAHLPDITEEEENKEQLLMFISEFSQFLQDTVKQRRSFSPTSETKMYNNIIENVSTFTMLMNWWVQNQTSKLTARMVLTTMEEEMKQCDGPLSKHAKLRFIFVSVEKIVLNICHNLKMMPTNVNELIHRIFDKVLDQVQDVELYLSFKSSGLYKKINKELLKIFGSPEAVLFLMNSEDPVIEECIAAVLIRKMVKPPNKNFIQKIFSFCNIFSKRR